MIIGDHIDYYSVFCPVYDANTKELDLLTEIRRDFLENKKRQKNKVVKEIGGKTYRYSYLLEEGKPAKWKKMLDDKLLERSRANQDNSYNILIQDENKNLTKILYFDSEHNWQRTEYFKNRSRISFSIGENGDKILVSEHKNNDADAVSYELFPIELKANEYKIEALNSNLTTLFCKTSFGDISYFTKEQLKKLHKLKKDIENSENVIEEGVKLTETKNSNNYENKTVPTSIDLKQNSFLQTDNLEDSSSLGSKENQFLCYSQDSSCPYSKTYGKTIKTEDDNTFFYFGDIHDNLRNGKGLTVTKDGLPAYEGSYKDDKKDGFGSFYYSTGKPYYIGEFKENAKHGFGILFSQDGNKINVGTFKEDKPQKLVSVHEEDGNLLITGKFDDIQKGVNFACNLADDKILIESFDNGKFTGRKTQFDDTGKLLYTGEFDGNVRNGFGIEYNADGTLRYKGNWKDDKYDGQGSLYFEDGRKIEGTFEAGKVEGFACEYDSRGKKIYEGNWKDNLYNEEGTKYLHNGNYLKGLFEDGLAQGVLLEFNANGDVIYKGNFNEDNYYGEGSLYVNGEKIYEGGFENNTYNGFGRMYENAVCVYEGQFKDGVRSGLGTSFRDDEIEYVGNWFADRYDGIGIIYEKAKPKYAGNFLKGKKEGRLNEIYEGKVIKECIFENDELVYAREYSYPDMNIVYAGNIHSGKRCGMGCLFTEYGEKEAEGIFANGEIVNNMRVFLKDLMPLPECSDLQSTEYEGFRFGPLYVIEKDLLGGIYSGLLKEDKPQGKGTILYSDHRYTGDFIGGVPKGNGVIYKNDGTQICGKFFESDVLGSTPINFESGRSYYFMSGV